jgi:anti-anti-sigma factor
MEALRKAVEGHPDDVEVLCDDYVLQPPRPESADDDVAVLAAQLLPVPTNELLLTMPAEPDVIASMRRAIRPWVARCGASREEIDDLVLATGEAVSNAIAHAYGPAGGDLEIQATNTDGLVSIRIRDHGKWRSPRDDGHGRGLPLMHDLVDEVEVKLTPEGTEVRLRHRIGGGPPVASGSPGPDRAIPPPRSPVPPHHPVVVVRLTGEIDLANAAAIYHDLVNEVGHDALGLVVDLTEVEYLDSAGLQLLSRIAGRLAPRRQGFRVVAGDASPVRRVLTLSGFESYVPVVPTVELAVKQIRTLED